MLSLFKPTRRHFIRLIQLILGSSLTVVFSPKNQEKLASAQTTESRIYYVYPSGNDTNPGTLQQPWKTIQKAANTLQAGEIVYLREGTYNITEQIRPKYSGKENQWIIYTGYPGEKVIIDADLVYVEPATGEPPFARCKGAFQI